MEVDVLYFAGCPNHEPTVLRVTEVAKRLDVAVTVREIEIRDDEDVARHRFLGSPTVRIRGADVERDRRSDEDFAMTCRRYGTEGVPPPAMIAAALAEAGT